MSIVAFGGDFEEANELFEKGKFSEARDRYANLVQRGEWSANLFLNLGNSEFRLGQPGRAALHYERALMLEPAHPEAGRNLQVVRDQAGSRLIQRSWLERLFPPLSIPLLAITASVTSWMALFILAKLFLARNQATGALWGALLFCSALAAYSGAVLWHRSHDGFLAIVTPTKQIEARLAPADRAELAATLPPGSRVRILSERGEWTYCELPEKGLGWIPSKALEKVLIHSS